MRRYKLRHLFTAAILATLPGFMCAVGSPYLELTERVIVLEEQVSVLTEIVESDLGGDDGDGFVVRDSNGQRVPMTLALVCDTPSLGLHRNNAKPLYVDDNGVQWSYDFRTAALEPCLGVVTLAYETDDCTGPAYVESRSYPPMVARQNELLDGLVHYVPIEAEPFLVTVESIYASRDQECIDQLNDPPRREFAHRFEDLLTTPEGPPDFPFQPPLRTDFEP